MAETADAYSSKDTLTPIDVAHLLRIAKNTVYELVKRGDLPAYRTGKMMRFDIKDVEAYKQRNRTSGPFPSAPSTESPLPPDPLPVSNLSDSHSSDFFLCGQDLLLDILGHYLESRIPGCRLRRSYQGSYNGLHELYLGNVQVASSHLWDAATDSYTLPFLPYVLPGIPLTVVRLVRRVVGFYVRNGNPANLSSWADLGRSDLSFVNRELGSGIRVLVDGKLRLAGIDTASVPGYSRICTTHLVTATTVARGGGDYAVGSEQTARQVSGISFVPLQEECYDLVFRTADRDKPIIKTLVDRICTSEFLQEIEALGGYNTSETGKTFTC